MTGAAYMNEVCTIYNYVFGKTADGGPAITATTLIESVPCKVLQNASRSGIEQGRILGRSALVGRFPRFLPSGAAVTLTAQSEISLGGVTYRIKSPPRFFGTLTGPYQEVDLEVKS
jgi:hypothetical protein